MIYRRNFNYSMLNFNNFEYMFSHLKRIKSTNLKQNIHGHTLWLIYEQLKCIHQWGQIWWATPENIWLVAINKRFYMLQFDWLKAYPTSTHAGRLGVVGHDLDWSSCSRGAGRSLPIGSNTAICQVAWNTNNACLSLQKHVMHLGIQQLKANEIKN